MTEHRPQSRAALGGVAVVGEFAAVGARLRGYADADEVLADLARICLRLVLHAEHAATSRRNRQGFVMVGATSDIQPRVDRIQYALGHGPCVDAILNDNLFNVGDLRVDPRWPEFGRHAAEGTGILSMLSFRLYFEDAGTAELLAGLNGVRSRPESSRCGGGDRRRQPEDEPDGDRAADSYEGRAVVNAGAVMFHGVADTVDRGHHPSSPLPSSSHRPSPIRAGIHFLVREVRDRDRDPLSQPLRRGSGAWLCWPARPHPKRTWSGLEQMSRKAPVEVDCSN